MKYPVLLNLIPNENAYYVMVPDLPGCSATGSNLDHALEEIATSIKSHLAILSEYGEKIPQSNTIEFHKNKVKEGIWAVIDIDITAYMGRSHKINVTLPELLIAQIDEKVSKSEVYKTRSNFIAIACMVELKKTN